MRKYPQKVIHFSQKHIQQTIPLKTSMGYNITQNKFNYG